MTTKINYSLHYKKWHSGSPEEYIMRLPFYEKLLNKELDKIRKGSLFLDYGCGYGHLVFYLLKKGFSVQGVDSSLEQVTHAKSANLPVDHVNVDNFPRWCSTNKNKFDVIFLFDVLEHVPALEQIEFLVLLSSTLKSEGVIYIKVPNAHNIIASHWRYLDWTHVSSFSVYSLDFVCENAGLKITKLLTDDSSLAPNYWFIPRPGVLRFYLRASVRLIWRMLLYVELGRAAWKLPVGSNIFVKAQKSTALT